jgi:cytochrome c5
MMWVAKKRALFFTGAVFGALVALAAGAAEVTALPEGTDRDLVSRVCQSCHDLRMVLDAAGFSRNDWDNTLEEMTANGMNISADDRAKILEYLSTYLGSSPPKTTSPP